MNNPVEDFTHKPYFVLHFGYSLILHALLGVLILYSFPVSSLPMGRPLSDYMMVMLPDKTEIPKEPHKDKVQVKKPKPRVIKKVNPVPKEPLPIAKKEEALPPPVVKPPPVEEQPPQPPPPPVVSEPPPHPPALPETPKPPLEAPLQEPQPVVPVQEPEAQPVPPVEPEPVMEAPEPPPLVAEAAEVMQDFTEPEPPSFSPALPSMINLPQIQSPASEPPIVVAEAEKVKLQDRPEPEVQALLAEPAPEEPVFIPPVAPVIVVTEPQEGTILNVAGGDTVAIRGTVDDPEIKTAMVILNGARVEVEVHKGQFQTMVSDAAKENTLVVEATNEAGLTGQSHPVRFETRQFEPPDIQVILSCKASCVDVRLTALKGDHPQSQGYLPFKPPVEIESPTIEYQNGSPYLARLMTISESESRVYTIRLDSHSSQTAAECDPHLVVLLYGYSSDKLRTRVFRPSASTSGEGPWILARFLMPQGFFWDDDDWTTGQIEDSRSITKFSFSLGIVWKELK